ncbi:MAG TPA: LacI family DNA-binding transcriptional regulator [Spirochaetia bacterium]|nr:LacI family DNA-binding transcriptional regulator [Spirochaetia bacterium]
MLSQEDVARRAGVSVMTVSRVVNGRSNVRAETRERVERAIRELSYYPNAAARALNRNRTGAIEVTVPHRDYFYSSEYFSELVFSIEAVARTGHYNLILTTHDPSGAVDYGSLYRQRKVDGLLLVALSPTADSVAPLCREHIPLVLVNARRDELPVSSVDVDNQKGAALAVEHLLSRGHERIATITGGAKTINAIHRLQGYRGALAAAGVAAREHWIVEGDWSEESGYAAFRKLLAHGERPSALFCANDLMAVGALRAAADSGVDVPGEVSIVGFDDIRLASFVNPRLTTVRQPIAQAGQAAARILLARLADPDAGPEKLVLEPDLVVRASTSTRAVSV